MRDYLVLLGPVLWGLIMGTGGMLVVREKERRRRERQDQIHAPTSAPESR